MADVIEFIRQLNSERPENERYGLTKQNDGSYVVSKGGNKAVYSLCAESITATEAVRDKFDRFDFNGKKFLPWEEFFNIVLKDFYDANRFLSYGAADGKNTVSRERVELCVEKAKKALPEISAVRRAGTAGKISRCLYEMAVKFRFRSNEGADGFFINKFYFSDVNNDGLPTLFSPERNRRYYALVSGLLSAGNTKSFSDTDNLGLSLEVLSDMAEQIYQTAGKDITGFLVGESEGDGLEAWKESNRTFLEEYERHINDEGGNPIKKEDYSLTLSRPVIRYVARLYLPVESYPFLFKYRGKTASCELEADTVTGTVSLRCPKCGKTVFSTDKNDRTDYGLSDSGDSLTLVYDCAEQKFVCSDCATNVCAECGAHWSNETEYDSLTFKDGDKMYCREHTVVCSGCKDKFKNCADGAAEYDKCDSCGKYVCKKCQSDNLSRSSFGTVMCEQWTDDCGNKHQGCVKKLCSLCMEKNTAECVSCGKTLCVNCSEGHSGAAGSIDGKKRYYHFDTKCCEICYHTYEFLPKTAAGKNKQSADISRRCELCGEVFVPEKAESMCRVCKPLYDIDVNDPESGKQYADYYKKYYRGAVLSASPQKYANANNGVAVLRVKDRYYKICKYDGRERNIQVRPLDFHGGK